MKRPAEVSSGQRPPRFEALVAELLCDLDDRSESDLPSRLDTALERARHHFRAERIAVEPLAPGSPAPPAAEPGAERLRLALAVSKPGADEGHTLAAERPGRPWTARELARLRVVAGIVSAALRQHEHAAELRESQVWLFFALESATIGTWDWDVVTDRVRFIAPFNRDVPSLEVRETDGSSWFTVTHPDDVPAARDEVDRALRGESDSFAFTVRSRRPPYRSGEWIQIYSRGRVIERDAAGRATRVMGVHEDVTEAKRREAVEREREATLAQAGRLLALSALTSSIAHEVNQPLSALTSFLQAARRLLDQGEEKRGEVGAALERGVELAERASEIVARLRRLLRREQPLRERIFLPEVLEAIRERLAREAQAAGVELRLVAQIPSLTFEGDRIQIEQALTNLVRNAVEALAGHERAPRIVTLGGAARGESVEMHVSDNGPGVPAETRERLFEPFFTTKTAGTGLGLLVCLSIAELHGGHVRLDRTGPEGSCFVLELPLRPPEIPGVRA